MLVSHYLVSLIQVVGLVVGLLGFFYLSLGLFDRSSLRWFRPLLAATAFALVGGVGPVVVHIPGQGLD
jgi:hypothetical protein